MKFHINKITDNFICVTFKEGSTSVDMNWLTQDEARSLLDSLNYTCQELRDFIGIDDPRTPLLDGLKEIQEFLNDGDFEAARQSVNEALGQP